jgi:hypothetical protein
MVGNLVAGYLDKMTCLCVCGPAHPLVDEDGVAPHLVRYDHRLECVRLPKKKN